MKIVNADWEYRNLGVTTIEIEIEEYDTRETILTTIQEIRAQYIVLKLPSHKADMTFDIQKSGYTYIEDMVQMVSYLKKVNYSSVQERFNTCVSTQVMTEEDLVTVKQEIKKGLFSTDRVYLDPYFSKKQAYNRYINWIEDEYLRKTQFIKYIYKGNTIGFFALREQEKGRYTSFLGGIFPAYRKGGIGTVVKVPQVVQAYGGKSVSTNVSSNNPTQIRNLILNGYIPESITHTFIKHLG